MFVSIGDAEKTQKLIKDLRALEREYKDKKIKTIDPILEMNPYVKTANEEDEMFDAIEGKTWSRSNIN